MTSLKYLLACSNRCDVCCLAFDALQRDVRGSNAYLPVPSVKRSLLSQSFGDFCCWAAAKKSITLPENLSYQVYLDQADIKLKQVARLELLRQVFRRTLEAWLALDRVCYMLEGGYEVTLGEFCVKPLTPRNLMIKANMPA